jgi:hypothetical protein
LFFLFFFQMPLPSANNKTSTHFCVWFVWLFGYMRCCYIICDLVTCARQSNKQLLFVFWAGTVSPMLINLWEPKVVIFIHSLSCVWE